MKRRLDILVVLVALVAAACSVARPSSGVTSSSDSSTAPATESPASTDPSADPATGAPTEAPTSDPTEAPPDPTDAPTEPATEEPTEQPTSATGADACTGSQDNQDFFASVARDMDWTVLCAVLPRGWSVQAGSYRLANGGRMVISYKSRAGATLSLSEGAFCADTDGCVPPGTDTGDAAFGPMTGTLVALDDGGWAIVVDRGAQLSWLLVAHGVDEATATGFGAALAVVEG
ncbi:MAG: hypothetical protein A2V85_08775 [Chloroflexi bacterium RBG_16_72_14]|nr:MAG: hypothetical protein A2V85_08775 [Chloroflexi bacterium RBG_16_72_14]